LGFFILCGYDRKIIAREFLFLQNKSYILFMTASSLIIKNTINTNICMEVLDNIDEVEIQLIVEELINELEDQVLDPNIRINHVGQEYHVKTTLRSRFPNSYFLEEVFDDAIVGIDVHTGSIIYEWMYLGHLRILNSADPSWGDLGDRIWGAVDMSKYLEEKTDNDFQGKIRPSIVITDEDYLSYWDDRYEYS
jgi:hypothetical protein